jgi:hypothetical protein
MAVVPQRVTPLADEVGAEFETQHARCGGIGENVPALLAEPQDALARAVQDLLVPAAKLRQRPLGLLALCNVLAHTVDDAGLPRQSVRADGHGTYAAVGMDQPVLEGIAEAGVVPVLHGEPVALGHHRVIFGVNIGLDELGHRQERPSGGASAP